MMPLFQSLRVSSSSPPLQLNAGSDNAANFPWLLGAPLSSFSLIAGIIKFGPIAHFIVMSPAFGRKTECVPQNFSSILLVNMKLNQCMRRILLDKIADILGMFLVNTLQPIGRATATWSRHGGILGTILIH